MDFRLDKTGGRAGLVLATGAVVTALGSAVALLADPLLSVSPAWIVLLGLAAVTGAVLVAQARRGRLLEPLGLVTALTAFAFVARPLQLLLAQSELVYAPFRGASTDAAANLLDLRTQEITLYIQTRLTAPLESSMARTSTACLLFFALLLVGFRVGAWPHLLVRAQATGRGLDRINVSGVVTVLAGLGLVFQILVLAKLGGPQEAIAQFGTQGTLKVGFPFYIGLACLPVALLIWACWAPPWGRPERVAFFTLALEAVAFYAATGSRTLLFTPVILLALARHFLHRRWSTRQLLVAAIAAILLASSYLALRQATYADTFGEALRSAPAHALDPRGALNDDSAFDILFMAMDQFPGVTPHLHGAGVTHALLSYVPRALDPTKPDGGDIWFRKLVWGERFQAGLPYTVIGEFYADFGWAGIAVGSLLLGLFLRAVTALIDVSPRAPGGPYRVALFAILTVVILNLITGTYTIALNYAFQLGVPFVLGVHLLGRSGRSPWRAASKEAA
jgi:oligosaccharide repeat unit polymerase